MVRRIELLHVRLKTTKMMDKKAVIEPINLIVGLTLVLSGVLFMLNSTSWGIFVAAIGLLLEAARHVLK